METRKKSALGAVIGGALLAGGLGVGPAIAAPPQPYTDTEYAECPDFDVRIDVEGKGKFIEVPGLDQLIAISPNTTVTVTNLSNEENTATYKANGAFHIEFVDDDIVVRATGVNVLIAPNDPGVFLTRGNVTFIVDDEGEVKRFEGPGNVTDICAALA